MAKCEICGQYGDTTVVTIGDKSTGHSRTVHMCTDCAVKTAVAIKSGGGEVVFVDGSESKKASAKGCASVILFCLAAAGAIGCLLAG
jgi:hypothetical protein